MSIKVVMLHPIETLEDSLLELEASHEFDKRRLFSEIECLRSCGLEVTTRIPEVDESQYRRQEVAVVLEEMACRSLSARYKLLQSNVRSITLM
jgi:hypothetical protein